jgi:hypothetical protein
MATEIAIGAHLIRWLELFGQPLPPFILILIITRQQLIL